MSSMYVEFDVVDTVGLIDDNDIAGDEEGGAGREVDDTPVADDEGE